MYTKLPQYINNGVHGLTADVQKKNLLLQYRFVFASMGFKDSDCIVFTIWNAHRLYDMNIFIPVSTFVKSSCHNIYIVSLTLACYNFGS